MTKTHVILILLILLLASLTIIFQLHRGPIAELKVEVLELKTLLAEKERDKETAEGEIEKKKKELETKRREAEELEDARRKLKRQISEREKGLSVLQKESRSKDATEPRDHGGIRKDRKPDSETGQVFPICSTPYHEVGEPGG